MLCEKCRFIQLPHQQPISVKSGWTRNPHLCLIKHHADLDDLIAAAETGCKVCQFFRPFVEYAKLRRRGRAKRSASDCSSTVSIGYTHNDPFEPDDRGQSTSSGAILFGSGDGQPPKYYVAPGKYYEEDLDSEKYCYMEELEVWTSRGITDHESAVRADEASCESEFHQRLAKLGLDADSKDGISSRSATLASGNSDDNDAKYSKRMLADFQQKYHGMQWVLATSDRDTGRDQLWMTLRHRAQSSIFNRSCADNVVVITLSAGSVSNDALEDAENFCVDGLQGYNRFTLAAQYPGLWKYHVDMLSLPQKRPRCNRHPILEFYQRRDKQFHTEPQVQAREVVEDPALEPVMQLAKSWLRRCMDCDEPCRLNSQVAMPSRLIDVGNEQIPATIKLYEVASHDEGIRYATLSHCWGQNTEGMTKLRQDNRQRMLQEIKLETIAQNFRDAIQITRGVGLRYLWIDALCIIQDSDEDWAAEAANMGDYYRGSELTISAFAASNAQHGILRPRQVLQDPPCIDVEGGTLYLRPLLSDTLTVTDSEDQSDFRRRIAVQPINERAWPLQERLFSRRILYFTDEQMIWQCRNRFFAEDGQYNVGEDSVSGQSQRDIVDILNYQQRLIDKEGKLVPATISSTQWYALIKAFTQRQLTYDRDRLPAISGLAREVHRLTGARYVAGLWFKNNNYTKVGLLWQPCRERSDGMTRTPGRADNTFPSWSWASLNAEIEHPLVDGGGIVRQPELDPKFVGVTGPLTSSDSFGGVKWGRLELVAWHHRYQGVRTYHELARDSSRYDWADEWNNHRSEDLDSPHADPFVTFDIDMPNDLWQVDGWWSHRCFSIMFVCYTNEFEDDEQDKNQHATQQFLVLEWGARQGMFTGWKRVGVAATPPGTLFQIDEHHAWERQKISIF